MKVFNIFLLVFMIFLSGCKESDKNNNATDLINSKNDLISYLSGAEYYSEEEYVTGELCDENLDGGYNCRFVFGKWSLKFFDSEMQWSTHDQVEIATYDYIDSTDFLINLGHTSVVATINIENQSIKVEDIIYNISQKE